MLAKVKAGDTGYDIVVTGDYMLKVMIGEGRVTGGGRKTFFAEGTVRDELGTLIAKGTGVFRYRGR